MKMAYANLAGAWLKRRDFVFFSAFILIYITNLFIGKDLGIKETDEVIPLIVIFGFLFTSLAWVLTRNYKVSFIERDFQSREGVVIVALLLYIGVCLILGNRIFFHH